MKEFSYIKIYNELKQRIIGGDFSLGAKIPTEPELCKIFSVSVITIRNAVAQLEQEGFVIKHQGKGTFVTKICEDRPLLSSESENYTWGSHPSMVKFQNLLKNSILKNITGKLNFVNLSPLSQGSFEVPADWKQCSLIEMNSAEFHIPNISDCLCNVPENFIEKMKTLFPEQIFRESITHEGAIKLVPTIISPTYCHIYLPAFEKAGIDPPKSWDWNQLLDICRILKDKTENIPFLVTPCPGYLFEIFLWQAGGDFLDEYGFETLPFEPFREMMNFLRTLHSENLCLNLYKVPKSVPEFYHNNQNLGIVLMGQVFERWVTDQIDNWKVVPMFENKQKANCCALFGVGINNTTFKDNKIWKLIEKSLLSNKPGFRTIPTGILPARIDTWGNYKGKLYSENIFQKNMAVSRTLPARQGFTRWWKPLYKVFEETMEGQITVKKGWQKGKEILDKLKIQSYERYSFI